MRPRRPPDRRGLFSENQKSGGFCQSLFLAGKLAFQILDPLLLFPCGLAHSGRAGAIPVIRLLTGPAPRFDLFGKKSPLATILRQIGVIHRSRLKHRRELARKEKALAETATLLVLRKKASAIWGGDEDA